MKKHKDSTHPHHITTSNDQPKSRYFSYDDTNKDSCNKKEPQSNCNKNIGKKCQCGCGTCHSTKKCQCGCDNCTGDCKNKKCRCNCENCTCKEQSKTSSYN